MAANAYQDIQRLQGRAQRDLYHGKPSDQLVDELRSSVQYQHDGSDLVVAASNAIHMIATLLVASDDPKLHERLQNGPGSGRVSMRQSLLEVINGGQGAFIKAQKSLATLSAASRDITSEHINQLLKALVGCTRGPYGVEELQMRVDSIYQIADRCATTATDIREAFSEWGLLLTDLHAVIAGEQVDASRKRFSSQSPKEAVESGVRALGEQLKKAETRLELSVGKVPGPWIPVIPGAITDFSHSVLSLVSSTVEVATSSKTSSGPGASSGYAGAIATRAVVNHIQQSLGNDSQQPDMSRFGETETLYLSGLLQVQREYLAESDSDVSRKVAAALESLTTVVKEIEQHVKSSPIAPPDLVASWRNATGKAQEDLLEVATVGVLATATNAPNPFATPRIEISGSDVVAQKAQLDTIVQDVYLTHKAREAQRSTHELAKRKHLDNLEASSQLQEHHETFQRNGELTEKLHVILQDSIAMVADLTAHFGKIERRCMVLASIIQTILMPLAAEMRERASRPALANGQLADANVGLGIIYALTMQLKAHYCLLMDATTAYGHVDMQYLGRGFDMCEMLAQNHNREDASDMQDMLFGIMREVREGVREFTTRKDRDASEQIGRRLETTTEMWRSIEDVLRSKGLTFENGAKAAIEAGVEAALECAKKRFEGPAM